VPADFNLSAPLPAQAQRWTAATALGILVGLLLIFEVVEPALPEPGHLAVQSIRGASAPSRAL